MMLVDQPLVMGLRTRWARLSSRDRSILVCIVGLVIAAVLYLTLWLPAANGIDATNHELSGLRAEHAQLEELANEARRLRGGTSHEVTLPADQRGAAVRRTIERAGLGGPPAPEVVVDETGAVVARFADVDYAGWILWLGRAEAELGAAASKVTISELPTSAGAGHVRAEITLGWADKKRPAAGAGQDR